VIMSGIRRAGPSFAALAALLLAACSVEPQPIHLGSEECSHCRMVISDRQFTAQALTAKGRAFKFDAIECLAGWVRGDDAVPAADLHSLWVADFADPEAWLPAEGAVFLKSPDVRSPMGAGLTAHASAEAARRVQADVGGEILTWSEVVALAERQGGHDHHHHASR